MIEMIETIGTIEKSLNRKIVKSLNNNCTPEEILFAVAKIIYFRVFEYKFLEYSNNCSRRNSTNMARHLLCCCKATGN